MDETRGCLRETERVRQNKYQKKKENKKQKNEEKVKLSSLIDDEEKYGYVPKRKKNYDSSAVNITSMKK